MYVSVCECVCACVFEWSQKLNESTESFVAGVTPDLGPLEEKQAFLQLSHFSSPGSTYFTPQR